MSQSQPLQQMQAKKQAELTCKSELHDVIVEKAKDYVWGVKSPGRVANQYRLTKVKLLSLIKEALSNYSF